MGKLLVESHCCAKPSDSAVHAAAQGTADAALVAPPDAHCSAGQSRAAAAQAQLHLPAAAAMAAAAGVMCLLLNHGSATTEQREECE